jgi:hypothetical protein
MFERWAQENFFKYLREEYALDALVDYETVPDNPQRDVPNPKRLEMTAQLQQARAEFERLTAEYGAEAFMNPEQSRPTMRGFKRPMENSQSASGKRSIALPHLNRSVRLFPLAFPLKMSLRGKSSSSTQNGSFSPTWSKWSPIRPRVISIILLHRTINEPLTKGGRSSNPPWHLLLTSKLQPTNFASLSRLSALRIGPVRFLPFARSSTVSRRYFPAPTSAFYSASLQRKRRESGQINKGLCQEI